MPAEHARAPIRVTHERGVQFAAQIRSHTLFVDQPVRGGGEDSAPSPIELLGAALGTCVALYVQQFCHARGLRYEGFSVAVEQHGATNPSRIGKFAVHVSLPVELPPQYAALIDRVARSCPAHNTLSLGTEVAVTIGVEESTAVIG